MHRTFAIHTAGLEDAYLFLDGDLTRTAVDYLLGRHSIVTRLYWQTNIGVLSLLIFSWELRILNSRRRIELTAAAALLTHHITVRIDTVHRE